MWKVQRTSNKTLQVEHSKIILTDKNIITDNENIFFNLIVLLTQNRVGSFSNRRTFYMVSL